MPTSLPPQALVKRFPAPSAPMALALRWVAALGLAMPLLFALWTLSGFVRDWSFNQVILYPVRCRDAACRDWDALPRVRYAVDSRREEVVFWPERGWLGIPGTGRSETGRFETGRFETGTVYRFTGCIIADRTTWTCRSRDGGNILAFDDSRPLRIDAFPVGSRLVASMGSRGGPYRFVTRLQWYRSVLAAGLTSRRT